MSRNRRNEKIKYVHTDFTLVTVVLLLLCLGLVMLYSVSTYDAVITFKGDAAGYFKKQMLATVIGIVVMVGVSIVDYHLFRRLSVPFFFFAVFMVALVLTPLGIEANGARRWLRLGFFSVQPAEIGKVAVIVLCANIATRLKEKLVTKDGAIQFFAPAGIMSICILVLTRNMSTALIVAFIAMMMYFVATPGYKYYVVAILGIGSIAGLIVLLVVNNVLKAESSFRIARIRAWIYPEAYSGDTAFQTVQSLYAIGSGGFFGKGLGESMQKKFIPEAQNDMIFSIICEELGLFGAILILVLFIILLSRIVLAIVNTNDSFAAMVAVGVFSHIAIQVILNIAVVTNVIPNTGISLPFISYGGSSVAFLLMEIGLVLSIVSRSEVIEEDE